MQREEVDLTGGAPVGLHLRHTPAATAAGGRVTCESRSRARSRFQAFSSSSSKISLRSERPNSENDRRCVTCGMPFITISSGIVTLLLDLFGGDSRPLGDDLDVVVGDVGIGLDGKRVKRDHPSADQEERESQDKQAFVQGKINYPANH